MKKSYIISSILITIGIAGGSYYFYKQQTYQKEEVPAAVEITKVTATQEKTSSTQQAVPEEKIKVPSSLNLKMTFYSQAPFGDWDYPWQEACEEATLLLIANAYYDHDWTREEFRDEILKMVEWQNEKFGYYKDTTAAEITRILSEYLNLQSITHKDPTYEQVQRILMKGHLIVGLFAGKELGNPFYTDGGPPYHAMVLKGYKEGKKIITADVGTRRGEDYVFTWDRLYSAMHDFDVPIQNGEKVIIEVIPPHF